MIARRLDTEFSAALVSSIQLDETKETETQGEVAVFETTMIMHPSLP